MAGYSKLFSGIVTSSIWCEDYPTRLVWVAMLATCDADGKVEGSVPGFANLARVTIDEMRAALAKLMAPDPDSRTPDNEGRRIEVIPGGWRILNYAIYRNRLQEKQGSRAGDMRRSRDKRRNALHSDVTSTPIVTSPASASAFQGGDVCKGGTTAGVPDWAPPIAEEAS